MSPWSGQLSTRFCIFTNELPRLADSSGALASRFVVLMLEKSFYNRENPKLTEELTEELPAIFNWSLDGLQRLRGRGRFQSPATSREAIQELEDLASPVGAFMRDRCAVGADLSVAAADLYRAYRLWCEEHGRQAINQQLFGRDLRAVRPGIHRRRLGAERVPTYVGIGLATPATPAGMSIVVATPRLISLRQHHNRLSLRSCGSRPSVTTAANPARN